MDSNIVLLISILAIIVVLLFLFLFNKQQNQKYQTNQIMKYWDMLILDGQSEKSYYL